MPRLAAARCPRIASIAAPLVAALAVIAFAAAPASAAPCGPAVDNPAECDIDATLTLAGGQLSLAAPPALAWSATLSGLDQNLVDPTVPHQTYVVNDATGTAGGWKVTAQAPAFTCTVAAIEDCGTDELPATAFRTNGSLTDIGAATAPAVACTAGATGCTVAETDVSYPVTIGTTATKVFNAEAGTGLGSNTISSVGWWLHVPADTRAGTYSSTVTVAATSAP